MDKVAISNNINYFGSVKLSVTVDGKKYDFHNTGTADLFRVFAKALCGMNISTSTPYYILGVYTRNNSSAEIQFLKDFIYVTARNFVDDENGGCARMTASIRSTDLQNIPTESSELTGLTFLFKLYAADKQTVLASVAVPDSTMFTGITAAARIIVEWSMQVRNPSEQGE